MPLSPSEQDNITRWNGYQRPFYEIYYLKWNDPRAQIAGWLRYTLTSPISQEPSASVWGIFFDAAHPEKTFGLKKTFPIRDGRIEKEIFYFGIGPCSIYQQGARGELLDGKNRISWDLKFHEESIPLRHFPWPLYQTPRPSTKFLAPHFSARLSGELVVNERNLPFERVPAHQGHLWGTEMAPSWVWGNCNAFEEDPGFCFEGLAVPHRTLLFFYWEGKLYPFRSPFQMIRNRSRHAIDRWHFEAGTRNLRFVGDLFTRPEEMAGLRYEDPTGGIRFCHNTKVADLKITILERKNGAWEVVRTLHASKTAAFEVVQPNLDPLVRLMSL